MGGKAYLLLFSALLLVSACTQLDVKDQNMIDAIEVATVKGMAYLSENYGDYSYNDRYLTFVYSGESLGCPIDDECNITYRLLDAYFDVYFLEEVADISRIPEQAEDAHVIVEAIAKSWEDEKISNAATSDGEGVALDTYCIVGYITENKVMSQNMQGYLEGNSWMPNDYYQQDVWRNIADESWCARLMIKTGAKQDAVKAVIYKLVDETQGFKLDETITDTDKLSMIYHMLYLVKEYEDFYGDDTFHNEVVAYSDFLNYFTAKNIGVNNLMNSNLLDAMVYAEYDNPAALRVIAGKVLEAQRPEGHWRMTKESGDDFVQVFTTFRALIALNQYKQYLQSTG